MDALANLRWPNRNGGEGLNGLAILVHGATGQVGGFLSSMILEKYPDAYLILAGRKMEKLQTVAGNLQKKYGSNVKIEVVSDDPEDSKGMYSKDVLQRTHILSPNAISETLNEKTVPMIAEYGGNGNLGLVVGGANCQYQTDDDGKIREDLAQQPHAKDIFVYDPRGASVGGIGSVTEAFPMRKISEGLADTNRLLEGARYLAEDNFNECMRTKNLPHLVLEKMALQTITAYNLMHAS
jgi:hypothetical protein